MQTKLPVSRPFFAGNEERYVSQALASRWISSSGEFIERFESSFSTFVECREGVACSNGTCAVHLALVSAGIKAGDRVVVPTFTMMASIFPIVQLGAIPVFVDCDKETWTMDASKLSLIEGPVHAVLPVHIYGHPCDMDPILEWAKARKAIVIEDAAEAHGATYKGKKVGSLGDLSAFSFYANKIITCGEGGMVTTNRKDLAERARYFRNLCFDLDPNKRFIHQDVGYNFRMTNVQAAIGLAQTEHATELVKRRQEMARKYQQRLSILENKLQLPAEKDWATNVFWMFGVVLRPETGLDAVTVSRRLREAGVETRRFFCPAHLQPSLKSLLEEEAISAPVSESLWERGFYLPSSSDLSDAEADHVFNSLKKILE